MSDKEKQELQDKIIKNLESDIKKVENVLGVMKENLQYLKDIVWDRQSQMEREQMLKVLNGEQESTEVESKVGNILVDSELTEKLKKKHLDDPKYRGMVTSDEFLSFPKVAKNVEAEFDNRAKGYTWRVKADDGKVLRYGSREYEIDEKDTNRLITSYSETEYGERQDRGEQGQIRREFNDRDFLRPANEIIPQNEQDSANKEQEINNYNPNDSSAMDMFGKEHFEAEEKAKQETRDKEQEVDFKIKKLGRIR